MLILNLEQPPLIPRAQRHHFLSGSLASHEANPLITYQSYQEGGRWVNFWGRDRPSGLQVGLGFALYDDLSGIPDVDDEVPDLPVKPPYWMRNNNTREKQHFGSLDKGVATNAIICFFLSESNEKNYLSARNAN